MMPPAMTSKENAPIPQETCRSCRTERTMCKIRMVLLCIFVTVALILW